jgi:hypothetical protein
MAEGERELLHALRDYVKSLIREVLEEGKNISPPPPSPGPPPEPPPPSPGDDDDDDALEEGP